jgi:hypothetical protein
VHAHAVTAQIIVDSATAMQVSVGRSPRFSLLPANLAGGRVSIEWASRRAFSTLP